MKTTVHETELIIQAQQNDTHAFRKLFEIYKLPVYNFILRMNGRQQDAEDILQEVFVKMFQKLPTLREARLFSSWLFRIAKNETINHLRKNRPGMRDSLDDRDFTEKWRMPEKETHTNPDRKTEQQELEQKMQAALNELPEIVRAAFIMGVMEGYSYKEVAKSLGCSVNNVKTRVFRARTLLSKKLRPYFQA